jgi:fatty acid desaturase
MKHDTDPTRFRKRSDLTSLAVVAAHLALVLAPVYLAAATAPGYRLVVYWLWFGLTMNGLLNLMHECAHYSVFRPRWASNVLGRWVLGPLLFADFDSYRQRHWDHHRNLGLPDDPKYTYRVDIRGWRLLQLLARCLFLMEAIKKFRHQTGGDCPSCSESRSRLWIARTLLVQALFSGSLLAVAVAFRGANLVGCLANVLVAYCGVYMYGLMTLTVFAATLRAIAEHQLGADSAAEEGNAALRNFRCGPLARLLFGAYGFSEHATHHNEPGIPYYKLRAATARLAADHPALAPGPGYIATLAMLVHTRHDIPSKEPDYSTAGSAPT